MTKADIVEAVWKGVGLTRLETEALVDAVLGAMSAAMVEGKHIEIRGFGTFRVKKRRAKMARNPRSGEEVWVDVHYVPTFKPSPDLRKAIDTRLKKTGAQPE